MIQIMDVRGVTSASETNVAPQEQGSLGAECIRFAK
jgi:hypothetical protein